MKLKKRIYLLTPLLVLVCVIAAGVFMKAPANVEAESYLVKKGDFEATKLSEALKDPSNTQYEIKEFDTYMFDYNGEKWNNYWEENVEKTDDKAYFFAFKNGDTGDSTGVYNVGMNSGGKYVKQGILNSKLNSHSLPTLSSSGYSGGFTNLVGAMLFAPTNDFSDIVAMGLDNGVGNLSFPLTDIRTAYKAKFEFVYDKVSGSYTYNSSANHAQFANSGKDSDGDSLKEGKVELYTDTLSMTNGMVEQMSLMKSIYCSDMQTSESSYPIYTDYEPDYGQLSWNWQKGSPHSSGTYFLNHTRFTLGNGTANTFKPHLRLKKFIKPSSGLNSYGWGGTRGDNYGDAVDSLNKNEVDYIYVKFKINSSDGTDISGLAGNAFQLVLNAFDGWTSGSVYDIQNEDFYAGSYSQGSYAKFKHTYTVNDLKGEFIELYFPIKSNTGITFETIEQIILVPISSNDTNYGGKVAFDLYEFMIMYDEVAPNGAGDPFRDTSSISSFLPFQKIENSYPGVASDGNLNANIGYAKWAEFFSSGSKSNHANRGVENTWWSQDTTVQTGITWNNGKAYTNNKPNDTTSYDGGLTDIKDKTGSAVEETGVAATYGSAAHFGMSMSVDFFIPLNRMNGDNQIRFEFTGDDDLWVFVDGQLLLDMGGTHWARTGAINFTNGNVFLDNCCYEQLSINGPTGTINDAVGDKKNQGTAILKGENNTGIITPNDPQTTSWLKPGKHTMQIFYLERAAGVSNCYISFNLPLIPQGGLTVTKDIKEAEGSEIAIPKDLSLDGYDDLYIDGDISDDLIPVVKNEGGKNLIGWTKPDGNDIDNNVEPLVYTFEATYKIPKAYNEMYDHKYSIYKYSDNNIIINDLDIVNTKEPVIENGYYVYNVQFSVPVGYSANIQLPESSNIMRVSEYDSTQNDSSIDSRFELSKTTLTYGTEVAIGIKDESYNNKLSYSGGESGIVVTGETDIKFTFTNYYKAELYNIEIEKTFLEGKPVPVGQSILYAVECGLTHQEGETCNNPLCKNPLYVSMLIKDTKDADGNIITPNPNYVMVRDLPKGNYKITEKADWSWRYECYNIDVYRSEIGSTGSGTIISAEKK